MSAAFTLKLCSDMSKAIANAIELSLNECIFIFGGCRCGWTGLLGFEIEMNEWLVRVEYTDIWILDFIS